MGDIGFWLVSSCCLLRSLNGNLTTCYFLLLFLLLWSKIILSKSFKTFHKFLIQKLLIIWSWLRLRLLPLYKRLVNCISLLLRFTDATCNWTSCWVRKILKGFEKLGIVILRTLGCYYWVFCLQVFTSIYFWIWMIFLSWACQLFLWRILILDITGRNLVNICWNYSNSFS